jgi:hypothetical protein
MVFKNFYNKPIKKREKFTFIPKDDEFPKKLGQKYLHSIYMKLKKILPKKTVFEIKYNGKPDKVTGLYFGFNGYTFMVYYYPVKDHRGYNVWHPVVSIKGVEDHYSVFLDSMINNPKRLLKFLKDFSEA